MNLSVIIRDAYAAAANRPFVWGTDDCLTWAADIAEIITGRDPIVSIRGKYHSKATALRVMLANGWKSMGDGAATVFEEIPLSMVRTGDWVLVVNPDGTETMCVASGVLAAARSLTGMSKVSIKLGTRAFRVA